MNLLTASTAARFPESNLEEKVSPPVLHSILNSDYKLVRQLAAIDVIEMLPLVVVDEYQLKVDNFHFSK